MESVFTNIYEKSKWGDNKNQEYTGSSGKGSSEAYNRNTYVPFLKKFISDRGIKTVVDLGCGDFRCGKMIYENLDLFYTGYDAYKKVIDYHSTQYPSPKYSFVHLDFCNEKEKILNADLCILKDVIQHWSLDNINSFLDFLISEKKFKYILLCNTCGQKQDNTDIKNGDYRPLNSEYLPLKKYNPVRLYKYGHKEVCVIEVN